MFFHSNLPNYGNFSLSEEESYHCIKVLRYKNNSTLRVTNGKGKLAYCKIKDANEKKTIIKIVKVSQHPKSISKSIHIAIAPTKNNKRFEWFLEKSVEIGIHKITPITTKYSELNKLNFKRLEKIMVSALKQSKNLFMPNFNKFMNFNEFINSNHQEYLKFICHNDKSNKNYFKNEFIKNKKYVIMIGPEGGFSNEEIEISKSSGFLPVLLGDSTYRTETAGILACHTIHLLS